MYKQDWYLRQIEQMVQFVAKVLFKKDIVSEGLDVMFRLDGGDGDDKWLDDDLPASPADGSEGQPGNDAGDTGTSVGADAGGSAAGGAPGGDTSAPARPGSRSRALRREIGRLLADSQINEAENLLFESITEGDKEMLAVAVAFYERLNRMDDHLLASCAFSRTEIHEGLKDALRKFGAEPDTFA